MRGGRRPSARHFRDATRGCRRIGRAEIADDLDPGRKTTREDWRQHPLECKAEAALRILPTLELAQRQRALGQRFVHEEARTGCSGKCVDYRTACIAAIARKACRRADENLCHGAMLTGAIYGVKRCASRHGEDYSSIGTMAASFELRSVSDVFTLRTLRAAVSFSTKA